MSPKAHSKSSKRDSPVNRYMDMTKSPTAKNIKLPRKVGKSGRNALNQYYF